MALYDLATTAGIAACTIRRLAACLSTSASYERLQLGWACLFADSCAVAILHQTGLRASGTACVTYCSRFPAYTSGTVSACPVRLYDAVS
jgi:hypothetical protein